MWLALEGGKRCLSDGTFGTSSWPRGGYFKAFSRPQRGPRAVPRQLAPFYCCAYHRHTNTQGSETIGAHDILDAK
jgi:hypothetical protein